MKAKRLLSLFVSVLIIAFMCSATVLAAEPNLPDGMTEWTDAKPVYYNGAYYDTLKEALNAVYMSSPAETAEIYCKPGSDVGAMTHAHVADDIIIYGNGARVSGGEHDMEFDTYKYDRATGKQSASGVSLDKDITVTVKDLNGIAAWGQRTTDKVVNLVFENCQDMNRVYISGKMGQNNISLTNCSFVAANGSHANTSIYSNASGTVLISNCVFEGIAIPINMNNKSNGTQIISVKNCTFNDCAVSENAAAVNAAAYAAPVRVLAQEGAVSNLSVEATTFSYSEGKVQAGNGDILLGDGRHDSFSASGQPEATGTVTLAMENTKANIQVQTPGYYASDNSVADAAKAELTEVTESEKVSADTDKHFTVACAHRNMQKTEKTDATCVKQGNIDYWSCPDCDKLFSDENGTTEIKLEDTVIEVAEHNYVDGKCTVCGALDPAENPSDTDDNSNMLLCFALLLSGTVGLACAVVCGKKRKSVR